MTSVCLDVIITIIDLNDVVDVIRELGFFASIIEGL